jgi:hypothetical protein
MATEDDSEKTSADSQHPPESENGDSQPEEVPRRPSAIKRLWKKLGLDLELVLMMAKFVPAFIRFLWIVLTGFV